MIKYFFENTGDEALNAENRALFDGLKIMEAGEDYTKYMQKYPVIFLTLKSAKQQDFNISFKILKDIISEEFKRHEKNVINILSGENYINKYIRFMDNTADDSEYFTSLKFLSSCLEKAYGKKAVILIDEYDVPLEASYYGGFYDEMTSFISSFFESALKTNPSLEFAVLTGCLRISRESIFTGLNNLNVISILDKTYGEYFGFTEEEVNAAEYYGHGDRMDDIKNWYDGYIFGNSEVYNPWNVINFIKDLNADKNAFPRPHWANTSSNNVIRKLIQHADIETIDDLETLMAGGTITKPIREDITYRDIYESQDNLWNFLFFTGYLKKIGESFDGENIYLTMRMPNGEIRYIYSNHISKWFNDKVKIRDLSALYSALLTGDAHSFQDELSAMLIETISYMDSREAFYNDFLLGVLANLDGGYLKKSNREAGNGRFDICVYNRSRSKPAYILEFKIADKYSLLDEAADRALTQIIDKKYYEDIKEQDYPACWCVGIGFCGKDCAVKIEKIEFR